MVRSHPARHRFGTAACIVFAAFVAGCADGASRTSLVAPEADHAAEPAKGPPTMIVVLADGADASAVARDHGVQPRFTYSRALSGFAGPVNEAARAGLLRDARVRRVERDEVVYLTDGAYVDPTPASQQNATWAIDRLDQRLRPLDKVYSWQFTGAGVTAYIIDSGIRFDHVEFEGRALPGFDAIGDGRNGGDCHGHGTHVAGIVGSRAWGVAKDVRLVSARVFNCSGASTYSGIYAALDWIIRNNHGPAVANLSLGGPANETFNQAVRNLINAGVVTSVSAGNDNFDACNKSPASTAEAITVGATTSSDARASYSNYGPCVDVFAPGSSVVSASHSSTTGSATKSGTSMAAPHAAGVAALLLHEDPSLTPAQVHALVRAMATKDIVTNALSANAHLLYSFREGAAPPPGSPPPAPPPPPPPPTAPDAPADLSATLRALNRVDLSWSDRSANEDGFRVERRTGGAAYATIAQLPANSTSYSDGSVAQGQTYTYRVVAFNPAGSGTSDEASVTVSCKTKGKSLNCQ